MRICVSKWLSLSYNLGDALSDSIPRIVVEILLAMREDIARKGIIVENAEHEGCKLVKVVLVEKQSRFAILDEVWHLIAVPADAWKTESEGFDENETVSLKVTRHAEDITHIIILRFLVEWHLTYEVVAFNWILYRVRLWTNNIQFDILTLLT